MTIKLLRLGLVLACLPLVLVALGGCGQDRQPNPGDGQARTTDKKPHDHSDWWCEEHGVTEEECTRCHPKLVAKYKAKGDWCKKHNLPDSQCFVCHPEKEAEWAAKYEAKYGTKPPKPALE